MKPFQFRHSTSQQNCVHTPLSDEYRHLHYDAMMWQRVCHAMERELRVHCGLAEVKQAIILHRNGDMQTTFPNGNLPGLNGRELELTRDEQAA
jgi:hypothetical protein